MPTFLGSAVWRPLSRVSAALGSLHPTPIDHVLGVFLRESGEGEIEFDFREGRVQLLLFHAADAAREALGHFCGVRSTEAIAKEGCGITVGGSAVGERDHA